MKRVTFQNSKGLKLVGALHETQEQTNKSVIIAHGFTSNKDRERHIKLANALEEEGITAFRIDFGGCGESDDREITVADQVDDLKSAVSFLKSRGFERIGVLGESLGGLTALEAFDDNIKAMVLWAPVTKARWSQELSDEQEESLAKNGYYVKRRERDFKIPQRYVDERKNVDSEKLLGHMDIPVMIVHGTADETIPISDSEEAIELLPKGSKLERIEKWEHGDHKMDESMDIIIPKTVDWFKNI